MKLRTLVPLLFALGLLMSASFIWAQEETEDTAGPNLAETVPPEPMVPEEELLTYDDYTVKAYTITVFGGQFSGATYLDNMPLGQRSILTEGAYDIMGFDGEVLMESRDFVHYTGARKEIQPGSAFGGRVGIYISDDFHLDILGTFASAEVITTMIYTENPETEPDVSERVEVDKDNGYQLYKGGLALSYDAKPAKFFGIVPRLGFGLGGIINRFSELSDVTGLYLEGNFALNYEVIDNFQVCAQADLTSFAYDVEELGYSNMVNYMTFSLGLTVFLDVIPPEVRASHLAAQGN